MTLSTIQRPTKTGIATRIRTSDPTYPWQLAALPLTLSTTGIKPTRREFLIGAGSFLVFGATGCGGAGNGGEETATERRSIEHKYGTTEISGTPERVVSVGFNDQDPILALGVRPVGVRDWIENRIVWPWNQEEFGEAEPEVLPVGELNFEQISTLEPDLIIGVYSGITEEEYSTLSQIAPTVLIQIFDRDLDEALLDFADLVGRTDRVEELRAEYVRRVDSLLDELGDRKEELGVSVITSGDSSGQFYRADVGQALGTVMGDLNLPRPAPQRGEGDFEPFSMETLSEHDADVVLVVNYSEEGQDPNFKALVESPLYKSLAAYEAGQTYIVDGTETVGAAWARMGAFLDELERILLDLDTGVVKE